MSCVEAGGCVGDCKVSHLWHACIRSPAPTWTFYVTQPFHPEVLWYPLHFDLLTVHFCQMFIQCSLSLLPFFVYLIYFSGCPWPGDNPPFLISCSTSRPNSLLVASHSVILLPQAGSWESSSLHRKAKWL